MHPSSRLLALFGACWLLVAQGTALAAIRVDGAWIREAPPGRDITAAYLTLHNDGDVDQALIAAECPAAGRVELHTHSAVDGMMRMRQVDRVGIPARDTLSFAPGGLHLMLFDWSGARAGERVPMTLVTEDGETLTIEFEVAREAP
ncbi:MAG: copper chaperone PCu(A)C [Pseudomonadales bacterium]|jgi:copper(I)-binding protein|nr:copper chaperone PCu(A)C [Pseudomonadales bacterium]